MEENTRVTDSLNPFEETKEPERGLFYQDFLPAPQPSRSSCCSTGYSTFGEIVQDANSWLSKKEKIDVVSCEVISVNPFEFDGIVVHDSWPYTQYLRGLRIWWKKSTLDLLDSEAFEKRRFLLGYRDFIPKVDRKSMFTGQYENAHQILMRINEYIASKTTPFRLLSLQSLDIVTDGSVDYDVDTDESQIVISQHGYTRFVRILRVFILTQYPRIPRPQSAKKTMPRIDIKDFTSKPDDTEGITSIMSRVMAWCSEADDVALLNVQVLSCRAGTIETESCIWKLESPGHIPNKFNSFVRVVYMSTNINTCGIMTIFSENCSPVKPINDDKEEEEDTPKIDENGIEIINADEETSSKSGSASSKKSKIIVVKSTEISDETLSEMEAKENAKNLENAISFSERENSEDYNMEDENHFKEIDIRRKKSGKIIHEKSEESGIETMDNSPTLKDENEIEALSIIPDYDEIKNRNLKSKTFYPLLVNEGGLCSETQYESMESVLNKINRFISSTGGSPVHVHTQFQYFRGDYPDFQKTQWAKYLPGGSWLPICHAIIDPQKL